MLRLGLSVPLPLLGKLCVHFLSRAKLRALLAGPAGALWVPGPLNGTPS